jgi:hypothetical protein
VATTLVTSTFHKDSQADNPLQELTTTMLYICVPQKIMDDIKAVDAQKQKDEIMDQFFKRGGPRNFTKLRNFTNWSASDEPDAKEFRRLNAIISKAPSNMGELLRELHRRGCIIDELLELFEVHSEKED